MSNSETNNNGDIQDFVQEIIIGTYEDYVVGYTIESKDNKKIKIQTTNGFDKNIQNKSYFFEQSFAVRAHTGSVRCLASNQDGSFTFSSGIDEMFNIFDLRRRKLLHTMEGAFSCATFVDQHYLICGCETSGKIIIYQCKNASITQVKTLVGHKAPITSLSVHPSGKLLLSISKDNTLRTWNLIKGRQAYILNNLKSEAHLVKWSKTGEEFVIAANNEIYSYNNLDGKLNYIIKLEKRVNSIEFLTEDLFVVVTDSGVIEFFNLTTGNPVGKHKAHRTRIKSLQQCNSNSYSDQQEDKNSKDQKTRLFVTASSDGQVKLWSLNVDSKSSNIKTPIELANLDTEARIICMTTATYKC